MAKTSYKCIYSDDHDPEACKHCKYSDCIDEKSYKYVYENEAEHFPEIIKNEWKITGRGYVKKDAFCFSAYVERLSKKRKRTYRDTHPKEISFADRKNTRLRRLSTAKVAGKALLDGKEIYVYYSKYNGNVNYWYYFDERYGELEEADINWIRKVI